MCTIFRDWFAWRYAPAWYRPKADRTSGLRGADAIKAFCPRPRIIVGIAHRPVGASSDRGNSSPVHKIGARLEVVWVPGQAAYGEDGLTRRGHADLQGGKINRRLIHEFAREPAFQAEGVVCTEREVIGS